MTWVCTCQPIIWVLGSGLPLLSNPVRFLTSGFHHRLHLAFRNREELSAPTAFTMPFREIHFPWFDHPVVIGIGLLQYAPPSKSLPTLEEKVAHWFASTYLSVTSMVMAALPFPGMRPVHTQSTTVLAARILNVLTIFHEIVFPIHQTVSNAIPFIPPPPIYNHTAKLIASAPTSPALVVQVSHNCQY
jgi:hypothetical protein